MVSTSASTSYASVVTPLAQATTSEVVPSFEEEFIMGLIDVFYTHPEKSLSLVLRGSTISFNTLTYMLDHTIENILEVGWLEQICPLEQLAQNFKSDATELRRICEANFNPLIEEKLARISEAVEQTCGKIIGKVEKMSKELELSQTKVIDVADEMELLKQGILSNYTKIERAKLAIEKA